MESGLAFCLTAGNSGTADSGDIAFTLVDDDGNVLSTKSYRQGTGDGVITLSNGTTVARIPAGTTFRSQSTDIFVPTTAPDDVTVRLAVSTIYYHQGKSDQITMKGITGECPVSLIDTTYYGAVTAITPENSTGDRDIIISGRAVERATEEAMPDVPLTVIIATGGFERKYDVVTDGDGGFTYAFTPLQGESGRYNVCAVHPDLLDRPAQGTFTISRVSITPATINLSIPVNYEQTVTVTAETGDGTEVHNLRFVYDESNQPGGVYPDGVHVTVGPAVSSLGSKQSATLTATIWADNTAAETGKIVLSVTSDESGDNAWTKLTVNTHFSEAKPVLRFTPDHVETGVARPESGSGDVNTVSETITLENKGLDTLTDVTMTLLTGSGTAAPGWAYLNTTASVGDLAVGASRQVTVAFSPAETVAPDVYHFILRVTSGNYPVTDINLYVSVTESGMGNVLFKVSDIYTGTRDGNDQIIQGLQGAKITVQNEEVTTVEASATTDSLGEASFNDLPAGRYKCRITADSHNEYIGRFRIKPGVTTAEEVFLDYNLVSVEWEVNEITIEDRYEIILSITYETNVPAAVVVADPTSVTLPSMKTGDVFNGEIEFINYGLIRAENVTFTLPRDDQFLTYELLSGIPDTIEAKGRITVPYRLTCLQSFEDDGDGSGGGSSAPGGQGSASYTYSSTCGLRQGAAPFWWVYSRSGSAGSSSGVGSIHIGGATGTLSSTGPGSSQISGTICFADPVRTEGNKCKGVNDDSQQHSSVDTGSSVNTYLREYRRDASDLAVKVPGGTIDVHRYYYGNTWHWSDLINRLTFEYDSIDDTITTIDKGGVLYERSSVDATVYTNDVDRITKTAAGYRWENTWGQWREYDETGRMTAYGNRSGIVGTVSYETGDNGTATGITDRNGRQILWFEYTGDDLTAVYDLDNRRVEYTYTGGLLTAVTDVFGNDTTYAYDAKDRLTTITDAENRTVTITYDSYGNPASVKDETGVGHTFEFDYDEAKKETYARITYPAGTIKEVWYDRDGRATRVDRNGTTVYTFVRDGRNLIITDENNAVTRKEFDEWGKLTRVLYPDGTEVNYEYDARTKRRSKETDERGIVTTYAYDTNGNLIRKKEANGTADERITEYTYDTDGNLLTQTTLGDAKTPEVQTTNTYDTDGNLQTVTDPEGNLTQFTAYDIQGNILTRIDGRGKTWTYTYDNAGKLKTVIDPLSNTTEYVYDKVGNKTKEIGPDGKETIYTYDSRDRVITGTDTGGNTTMYEYNGDGKLTKQTDPDGKTVTYQYDADGRLAKTIDGAGNEITMEYDGVQSGCTTCGGGNTEQPSRIIYPTFTREMAYDLRGRKTKERDVLDTETTETSFTYDETGNLIEKTDREGKTTVYQFDGRNRLIAVTDPDQKTTAYTYDDRDNLLTLTDGENNTTAFEYDKNNRLTKETRPMGEETTYQYDENGNLIEKTDTKNQLTAYTYDDAGRLETIRYYSVADHTTPQKTVTFTYDTRGNLTGYDDGITSATYGYDDAYRKTAETVNYGAFAATNTYTYNKNGTKKTFTGPDNITYTYTYDSANRISSVTIPNQGSITWPTYTWTRPQTVILPGGSQKTYTYDSLMRVTDITTKDPGQNNILHYQYDYDRMDNIINKETEHGTYTYQYDNLYRLTEADNPTIQDEDYTYDAVGNRITSAQTEQDWTYNANNELETSDDTTYEYDANGNMIRKTVDTVAINYIYNEEDRLAEVRDGNNTLIAGYYYDPFGRRLWKEVGGVKTCFVYADEGLVGEYDATGTEIRSYGYKPDSTWTTDPLFVKENGTYYFYQNDHLGTPQKLAATNGAVVWSATYESFGKARIDVTSTITNNLRFPGQYYDAETGLHYNYFRYYDPVIGRYLRKDPIGLNGGVHYYRYAYNTPIVLYDSNGLYCETFISFTIPRFPRLKGSKLIEEGRWRLMVVSAQISISPNKWWGPITSAWKSGLATCSAMKKLVYEDSYIREEERYNAGFCFDECIGLYFWGETKIVPLEQWTEKRIETKQKVIQIKIQAASNQLARIACAKWVNTLN